jgi:AraC-like DNA-binding protein
MRPQFLRVTHDPIRSFNVRKDLSADVNSRWHYHPELELIHFVQGAGTQFIGDNIRRFSSGDMVLVGPNLPHYWRYDDDYFLQEAQGFPPESNVVHFREDFWGTAFLELPENKSIRTLLDKSRRGVQIHGEVKEKISRQLQRLLKAEGTERLILLMEILVAVAQDPHNELLCSVGYSCDVEEAVNDDRMTQVYEYTLENFRKRIQLEEIAEVAHISPNSFCRYFKSRTKKTYSQFLLEIRVGQACRMLMENNMSIKEICYESGFNNFSSFHKYFKQITGKSPLMYKRAFTHAVMAG